MSKAESINPNYQEPKSPEKSRYLDTELENVTAQEINQQSLVFDMLEADALPGGFVEVGHVKQQLVGMLMIEDKAVGLIRASKAGQKRYVVTRIDPSSGKFTLIDVLKPGVPLTIGRENFDEDDKYISKKHVELTLNEDAELNINDISSNGTILISGETERNDSSEKRAILSSLKRILGRSDAIKEVITVGPLIDNPRKWAVFGLIPNLIFDDESSSMNGDVMWDYTRIPTEESSSGYAVKGYEEPYFDENGNELPAYYLDRPVINRDSKINGGVYIVPGSQEAIVVDDGTKPKRGAEGKELNPNYARVFDEFISDLRHQGLDIKKGVKDKDILKIVQSVLETVKQTIKYDSVVAEKAAKYYADRKINLESFIVNGRGVCRHQALLVGYLLEKAIAEGYLKGEISIDRNNIRGKGGHAWARYIAPDGEVFIIDPTQDYAGTLEDSLQQNSWPYQRPEDYKN